MKLVGRFRTQEGRVVRVAPTATSSAADAERDATPQQAAPPRDFLVAPRGAAAADDADRDPWWFLRALAQEAYQKHF
ncbi:MAG: hypothetical protein HY049_05740 [Acidobacteria bacterium]|nr:hypothetical protein [Acidobacteriota bacterium]